ncbi:MAG: HD domain-containing protein [Planctomycetales bacterium]|nr:HD domain-containing protein [Planctomycetales bacterium]
MAASLKELPELLALDDRQRLIRIPQEIDVPVTPRVQRLIDTSAFRRLSRISQLGLVSLVYPAAHHTRFEHSLGVYRLALLYLRQLSTDARFAATIEPHDGECLLVAALLHDLGHWPYCHPIEDMQLPGVPEHEEFANSFLLEGEIAELLESEWGIRPREIVALLSEKPRTPKGRILGSILSGPIDIDKMDYLQRDSLHAGVPYGRNFDQQRLIGSLCLNAKGDGLALTDKGKTAAEMMVFARYVMFSEVYWHHTVRSATAMLQRAFFLLYEQLDLDTLFRMAEPPMIDALRARAGESPAGELLHGLFGPRRRLYKRLAQYSFFRGGDLYHQLARRPYPWLSACSEALARELSAAADVAVGPHELLIDAPPPHLEVEFKVEIHFAKERVYRPLGDVSPVVQTLAKKQFDDYVKQVRVFASPAAAQQLADLPAARLEAALKQAIQAAGD